MANMQFLGNMSLDTDSYIGGAAEAVLAHFAGQQQPVKFLADHGVSNQEALYGATILADVIWHRKMPRAWGNIMTGGVAAATGFLTQLFLEGHLTTPRATSGGTGTTSHTGWEVPEPGSNTGWDVGSGVGLAGDLIDTQGFGAE